MQEPISFTLTLHITVCLIDIKYYINTIKKTIMQKDLQIYPTKFIFLIKVNWN
jgi:hypothetical protein